MKPKKISHKSNFLVYHHFVFFLYPSDSALLKLLILFKNLFSSLLLNSRIYDRRKKHTKIFFLEVKDKKALTKSSVQHACMSKKYRKFQVHHHLMFSSIPSDWSHENCWSRKCLELGPLKTFEKRQKTIWANYWIITVLNCEHKALSLFCEEN